MITTLASGNLLDLQGATTGAATSKFINQTSTNQAHHVLQTEVIQRTATDVGRGTDVKFPPDAVVVEERGYLRITTRRTDTDAVEGVQQLQVDDRYVMREENGRFRIADWDLVENPVAVIPIPSSSPLLNPSPSPTTTPSVAVPSAPAKPQHDLRIPSSDAGSELRRNLSMALAVAGLLIAATGSVLLLLAWRGRSGEAAYAVEDEQIDRDAASPWRLRLRTIGRLEITEGTVDHAKDLLQHPVQSILWLYLLVLAIDGEHPRRLREVVAEAMWPKQSASTRAQRMRGRLSQRKRMLAPILADRILDDGESLEFDLGGCWVDAVEVVRLSRESSLDPELKSSRLRAEVAAVIEVARGQFLEFWEELESRAIEGDDESATRAVVEEVRGRVERCRVDLLLAMGRHHLWKSEARQAIPFLEEANGTRPDRDDVAESLTEAYRRSGRESEAKNLRESR